MTLSVIIPAKDRHEELKICLKSLSKQTVKPDEIIVVNNSPANANVKKVCRSFKKLLNIVYLEEEKPGRAYARNKGIEKAKKDLIAFLDMDCIAQRNWTIEIYKVFRNRNIKMVQGASQELYLTKSLFNILMYYERMKLYLLRKKTEISTDIDTKNFIIRKSMLLKYKLKFNQRLPHAEDLDFNIQVLNKGIPVFFKPEIKIKHIYNRGLNYYVKDRFYAGLAFGLIKNKLRKFDYEYLKNNRVGVIWRKKRELYEKKIKNQLKSTIFRSLSVKEKALFSCLATFGKFLWHIGFLYGFNLKNKQTV